MSKKPVSLETQLGNRTPPADAGASSGNVVALSSSSKSENKQATVYLPRLAKKRIAQMALDQDKNINDLLQEGVDLMLRKYGQPSLKEFEDM